MSDTNITELYIQEMTEAVDKLDLLDVEFEYLRYRMYDDNDSRDKLILRCVPMVIAIIKVLEVPPEFKDDCIQAGNLAIILALDTWKVAAGYAWTTWAWRHARLAMLREWKKLTGRPGIDGEIVVEEEELYEPQDSAEVAELHTFIQGLPHRQLELMSLVLEGKNISEAAASLGISRQAGHTLYQGAVHTLRKKLDVKG